jgi:hypothetical protein
MIDSGILLALTGTPFVDQFKVFASMNSAPSLA